MLVYLILNLVASFEADMLDVLPFVAKVFWMKSSTGVAKVNKMTAATSKTPVPTSVCFSNWMTGLTYTHDFHRFLHLSMYLIKTCILTSEAREVSLPGLFKSVN